MDKNLKSLIKKVYRNKLYILLMLSLVFTSFLSAQTRRDTTPGGRLGGGGGQEQTPELILGAEPVEGYIRAGQENWYIVRTTSVGILVVETHGSEIDTYMEIYDEHQEFLDDDDDGGEGLNARIEMYVSGNRTFHVKIRAYSDSVEGGYTITARLNPLPDARELTINATLGRTMDYGDEHWYRLRATQRGYIHVGTLGNNVVLKMEMYNENFRRLYTSNLYGDLTNAEFEQFVDGHEVFYFRVQPYYEDGRGDYRILATYDPYPEERNVARGNAVNIRLGGDPFRVYFVEEHESRWYRFEMPRGGGNIDTFTTGHLDTMLYLYDRNGEQLFYDDDSGEGLNAHINERLTQGTYYIEVKTWGGGIGRTTLKADLIRN